MKQNMKLKSDKTIFHCIRLFRCPWRALSSRWSHRWYSCAYMHVHNRFPPFLSRTTRLPCISRSVVASWRTHGIYVTTRQRVACMVFDATIVSIIVSPWTWNIRRNVHRSILMICRETYEKSTRAEIILKRFWQKDVNDRNVVDHFRDSSHPQVNV